MKTTFFAINRHTKRAVILHGFNSWEMVQGVFRVGILMPDGNSATGIGRLKSVAAFVKAANKAGFTILLPDDAPYSVEIESNQSRVAVSPYIWASWTGKRFLQGVRALGERFMLGTLETYSGKVVN